MNHQNNNNTQLISKTRTTCKSCEIGPVPERKCHMCNTTYCSRCSKWYTVVSTWYRPNIAYNFLQFTNGGKNNPKRYTTHKKQLTTTRIISEKLRTCDLCITKNKETTLLKLIRNNQEQKLHSLTKLPKSVNCIIINYMYAPKPQQRPPLMYNKYNESCILC